MRNIRVRTILLAAALLGGCNDSTVAVGNSNPLGTVGGMILDASTQMPLMMANVKVISGGVTFMGVTQADGTFSIPKVPSGPFIFNAGAMGYTTAQFSSTLFGAVGNFPVSNPIATVGPIGLIPATGAFNVRLVDETGAPVSMLKVSGRTDRANYVDFSEGNGFGVGSTAFDATSGNDGLVQFTGLPNYTDLGAFVSDDFTVDVPPTKVSGSESYSFLGLSQQFNLEHLNFNTNGQAPTIILAGPHTPLAVLGTNLAYLAGLGVGGLTETQLVGPNGPINIEFNQAIDPNTVRVVFYNEDAATPAQAQPMATVTTNLLAMVPNQALTAGARYNLLIHVDAAIAPTVNTAVGGAEFDTVVPFFVEQASGVTPTVNDTSVAKSVNPATGLTVVTFTLNEPIGVGQGNTNPIDCVVFYEGVNLDNGDPASYPGEWANNGQGLLCDSQVSPQPAMNATVLTPVEQSSIITGFASKFSVNINNSPAAGTNPAPCKPGIPVGSCAGPQSGNKIHLVFSKLPVGSTIRRTNGQVVTDDPTKLTLTIP
jgi:hypothetical protein